MKTPALGVFFEVVSLGFICVNYCTNWLLIFDLGGPSSSSRFVHPGDKNDIGAQVRMAAQCCRLTDILIGQEESLWMVPKRLIDEARSMNKPRLTKRQARKTKSESSAEIRLNHNPSHIHRLVVWKYRSPGIYLKIVSQNCIVAILIPLCATTIEMLNFTRN